MFVGLSIYLALDYKNLIDLRVEGDWLIEHDELIGFTASKNASSFRSHMKTGLNYHLFTDSRGARVNLVGQRTLDKVSIMTIGCSFSWGHGIENEQTFTEILGRKLAVPVVNLALGSYGTVQPLQLLQRNSDLKPDVIIYGFITDHLHRNLSPCAPSYAPFCIPTSYIAFDRQGNPYIHRPPVEYFQEVGKNFYSQVISESFGFDSIIWGARAILSKVNQRFMMRYKDDFSARQKSIKYLIGRMEEEAKLINATLIVVHIPYLQRDGTNGPPLELLDALTDDIVFIDLSPPIERYYSASKPPSLSFAGDGHPNHLAHGLIAHEIHGVLKKEGLF
jgi:hypothetical protein